MRRSTFGLLLVASIATSAASAEDADLELRAERIEKRIPTPRERIELMRRERRAYVPPPPPTEDELADERARTAFEDPYLVPGDVVVTRQGLFVYRGTPFDRERQPQDFVPIERKAAGR